MGHTMVLTYQLIAQFTIDIEQISVILIWGALSFAETTTFITTVLVNDSLLFSITDSMQINQHGS